MLVEAKTAAHLHSGHSNRYPRPEAIQPVLRRDQARGLAEGLQEPAVIGILLLGRQVRDHCEDRSAVLFGLLVEDMADSLHLPHRAVKIHDLVGAGVEEPELADDQRDQTSREGRRRLHRAILLHPPSA